MYLLRRLSSRRRLACAGALLWLLGTALPAVAQVNLYAPDGTVGSSREIRIGMVNAQSGPAAALGRGMSAGAQAVFAEVNAKGGVHGRKLVLRVADDGYEPDQTMDQTLEMLQHDNVLALFGFVGTPTVNAVLPLLHEMNVPLIGAFTGAMSLRKPVKAQVFNLRASYDDETEALVNRLMTSGARKIAVVYQNDGFGRAVLGGIETALRNRNLAVHAKGHFQRNTVAIRMALAVMVEQQPDAIVMAGTYVPVGEFITQARAAGLKSTFATVSFVGTESLLARTGADAEGMYISQVVPSPTDNVFAVTRDCRAALKRFADEALSFVSLEGCISARLLVLALQRAGPEPTRQSLMAALETIEDVDFGGFPVNLSADNHQASSRVYVTRVLNGRPTVMR